MTENIKELAKTTQPGTVLKFQAQPGKVMIYLNSPIITLHEDVG